MYKINKFNRKKLAVNKSVEGESLEIKIQRLTKNKEPLVGSVPLTYTERKDGVLPQYNVRADRFEIAAEAMDKYTKSNMAKRQAKIVPLKTDEEGKTKSEGEA